MTNDLKIEYIIETVDPLNQFVYLTAERFDDHIFPEHPNLVGEEDTIKAIVEDPEVIVPDKDFDSTQNYYGRHGKIIISSSNKYLKVVVDRELGGQIVTAYTTNCISEKTDPIYEKQK